jgi:hypothetical protein
VWDGVVHNEMMVNKKHPEDFTVLFSAIYLAAVACLVFFNETGFSNRR